MSGQRCHRGNIVGRVGRGHDSVRRLNDRQPRIQLGVSPAAIVLRLQDWPAGKE